jgi:DNA repair protein RadD
VTAPELRDYQRDAIAAVHREIDAGNRRIILVAPTGSGKTIVFGDIVRQYRREGKFVLVISHRREIIAQTSAKLRAVQVPDGIVQAGIKPRPLEAVQVASIQTLHRRAINGSKMILPKADLLVIDEAHHCPASSYSAIIKQYPDSVLLGLTATPARGDGRGLGGIFTTLLECPQVAALIEQGYLVKTRVYAPVDPDLRGVRTQAGDYVESQLAERMDTPKLIGDIVTHWHRFGENRKTVAFCVNVAHSVHLRDELVKAGVRAEHIDGTTPKDERDATLARLARGEITIVTNCMVLTEGWDMPEVGCCILARPTKKMGLYRQMIGRVLRPADGKADAIILDHSGAVFRHGFAEDKVEWTLDPDLRAISPVHKARCETSRSRLLECTQCSAIRTAGEPCGACGFLPQPPARPVAVLDGELGLVGADRHAQATAYDPQTRARWHGMLITIGRERAYKPGWASYKYKERFGIWPAWGSAPEPMPPSPEVRSWVRSRQIAFARRRSA